MYVHKLEPGTLAKWKCTVATDLPVSFVEGNAHVGLYFRHALPQHKCRFVVVSPAKINNYLIYLILIQHFVIISYRKICYLFGLIHIITHLHITFELKKTGKRIFPTLFRPTNMFGIFDTPKKSLFDATDSPPPICSNSFNPKKTGVETLRNVTSIPFNVLQSKMNVRNSIMLPFKMDRTFLTFRITV